MPAVLACLLTLLAAAPETTGAVDPRVESLWRLHFPRYAAQCLPFEDGYVCVPAFDPRYPSTRGVLPATAQRELSVSYDQALGGGMSRKLTRRPDDEEVDAYAALLPGLEVGHYGHIAAVRVDEVVSDDQMIVNTIILLDDDALDDQIAAERKRLEGEDRDQVNAYLDWKFAYRLAAVDRQKDRTYRQDVRLVGFPTLGLRRRQTWAGADDKGLDVAVVRLETYTDQRDRQHQRLVMIPRDKLLRVGLDEQHFLELLTGRGLDKPGFVKLIQDMFAKYRDDRTTAEQQVFLQLLAIDKPPKPSSPSSD